MMQHSLFPRSTDHFHRHPPPFRPEASRCSEIVVRQLKDKTLISLRYIPTTAFALVEHGPIMSEGEQCDAFRKLWQSRSELRRFKDGAVREAVVWSCERHRIIEDAVAHLMTIHYQLRMLWSSVPSA